MALRTERTFDDVAGALRERLGEEVLETEENHGQLIVRVSPERRPDALGVLKDLGFTYYSFCGGVDWPDDGIFEVLDQVGDIEARQRVVLKSRIPRDAARIPSAVKVYAGANWHERETWELFGIVFSGHPRLSRLLLPDWQEGFPLRKDYELAARVEKPWPGGFFEG